MSPSTPKRGAHDVENESHPMRMRCPIQYEIHGTTETNRRPARYAYREVVEVDICDVCETDAPVAVEWVPDLNSVADRLAYSDRVVSGPDGMQLTRWHEDAHWQRLCDGHFYGRRSNGPLVTVGDLESMLSSPTQDSAARVAIGLSTKAKTTRIAEVGGDPRGRFTSIRTDGRELAMDELEKATGGLISVDGIVHRKCLEPFICLQIDADRDGAFVCDLGIEATAGALWGPTSTTYAFFGLGDRAKALQYVNDTLAVGRSPPSISAEPIIRINESLTYDWDVTFRAAFEARKMQRLLRGLFHSTDWTEPKLDEVISSHCSEQQYEIMCSIDPDASRFAANKMLRRQYDKVMEILDGRSINIGLHSHSSDRPADWAAHAVAP